MTPPFFIGTSGWQYKHWRGRFYPPDLKAAAWFNYYAERFQTVEVNNSFYRQPSDDTWKHWAEGAPPRFRYAVKANRFITHIKRLNDVEEPLERFFKGANHLDRTLGPVLFQTPPNFRRSPENAARLEHFLSLLPHGNRSVIEFRHNSWFGDETLDLLRRNRVAFCSYDMPKVDCPLTTTSSLAYIRMHGSESIYASNYTDEMLRSWAAKLRALSGGTDEVWVFFNNDAQAFAVQNAMRLRELIEA
jgi:uncharacterized protein YecE (DUF72 family)